MVVSDKTIATFPRRRDGRRTAAAGIERLSGRTMMSGAFRAPDVIGDPLRWSLVRPYGAQRGRGLGGRI
jgi:hypothetical protein